MMYHVGKPVPMGDWWADMRWKIAGQTGWTLEYIDGLSLEAVWQYLSVADGRTKAQSKPKQGNFRRGGRGRR